MCSFGVILTVLAELLAKPLVMIFASYDMELLTITRHVYDLFFSVYCYGDQCMGNQPFYSVNNGVIQQQFLF